MVIKDGSQKDYTYYLPRHKLFTQIDFILTDINLNDRITSCTIGLMLWTDHVWLKCNVDLMVKEDTYKQWSFNKHILLTGF